jgi:hypothetical protein
VEHLGLGAVAAPLLHAGAVGGAGAGDIKALAAADRVEDVVPVGDGGRDRVLGALLLLVGGLRVQVLARAQEQECRTKKIAARGQGQINATIVRREHPR